MDKYFNLNRLRLLRIAKHFRIVPVKTLHSYRSDNASGTVANWPSRKAKRVGQRSI
jgi:hypothetical protein